jgi:hypothetical protein
MTVIAEQAAPLFAFGWIYDLWLLERIATALCFESLLAVGIGSAWKVPYGVGRRLTLKGRS